MTQESFTFADLSFHDYQSKVISSPAEIPDTKAGVCCPICSKTILGKGNLSFHMALHPVDRPLTCDFCVQIFRTKEELVKHSKNHKKDKKFQCNSCEQGFDTEWRLKRHLKTHSAEPNYKCPYCDDMFRNYDAWRHHEIRHTGPTSFKCDLCEVGFYTEEGFTKHSSAGRCMNEINCCDIVFKKRLEYVDHFLRKHHRATLEQHSCQFCQQVFPYASSKTSHEVKCAWGSGHVPYQHNRNVCNDLAPNPNEQGFYVCELCGMGCNSVAGLKVHHGRQHKQQKDPAQDKYECPFCEKRFSSLNVMYHHKKAHTKPHSCPTCDKKFAHRFLLRNHMYTHSQRLNLPFKCRFCSKTFVTKNQLLDHDNSHTGNRPYKCRHCENSFKKRTALLYHTLRHTGEKKFKCKFCGVAFTQPSTCKQHEKAHLRTHGKRKFECKNCPDVFWSITQLRSHQEAVHPETLQQKDSVVIEEEVFDDPMSAKMKIVSEDGQEHWVNPSEISTDEQGNMYYILN